MGAGPQCVLIIDDNVELAENIAEMLAMEGHVTHVAASAEEALPKAEQHEPDVVVTDYRLPGMTGAEFLRSFRERRATVRAVVISAYTDDRTIKDAEDAGAVFISKPVDLRALATLVREGEA